MRKMVAFFIFVLTCCLSTSLWAQEKRAIILKDGTKLIGEVVSFENGCYSLETSVGTVSVKDADVISILPVNDPVTAPASSGTPSFTASGPALNNQINAIQGQLMQDPDFIAKAQELSKNPEVIQVLSQPDVAEAVMKHDITALQSNPKVKDLLSNPQVLDLIQSTGQKLQQNQTNQ